MKVTIYHEVYRPFLAFDPDQATLEEAYTYERSPRVPDHSRVLASIFQENNVVEGNELPTLHETRSLSVGDVVRIDGHFDEFLADDQPHYFAVEPQGWRAIHEADVLRGLQRGQVFDPFEGL